jgi:flagellar protein FliJ
VKAYRFRLDSVLRVRRLQEQAATQQLAASVRALHHAQSESARARRSLEDMTAPAGRVTIGAFRWAYAQSTRMSETARERAEAVETAAETAREANVAWGRARQRTATLERLDERHVALWRRELDRSEAAVLDDLATRRSGAKGGPP